MLPCLRAVPRYALCGLPAPGASDAAGLGVGSESRVAGMGHHGGPRPWARGKGLGALHPGVASIHRGTGDWQGPVRPQTYTILSRLTVTSRGQ